MVLIRRAEPADAAGIARVQVQSWRSTYAGLVPDAFLQSMDENEQASRWEILLNPDNEVLVAERDGRIVGFAIGGSSRDRVHGCDAELYAIYLLAPAQRSGIGADLLRETARGLRARGFCSMDVWVLANNSANRFYEAMGAQFAGSKQIEIGGARLIEDAYVWLDLESLAARS